MRKQECILVDHNQLDDLKLCTAIQPNACPQLISFLIGVGTDHQLDKVH